MDKKEVAATGELKAGEGGRKEGDNKNLSALIQATSESPVSNMTGFIL